MPSTSGPIASLTVRQAIAADAEPITARMQAGMSANVQRITILGSPRLGAWVAGQLADPAGDRFLVAEVAGRVAGMGSSRVVGTTLMVNHLYTHPDFQRQGIARALLARALAEGSADSVAVDVFGESHIARRWYAGLGFAAEYRRVWWETALPAVEPEPAPAWTTRGLEAAEAAQSRQGFSSFQLVTPHAEYAIGRLTGALFRAIGFGILADPTALAALAALEPERTLLCIGAPEALPEDARLRGRILEESERLSVPHPTLATKLAVARAT